MFAPGKFDPLMVIIQKRELLRIHRGCTRIIASRHKERARDTRGGSFLIGKNALYYASPFSLCEYDEHSEANPAERCGFARRVYIALTLASSFF